MANPTPLPPPDKDVHFDDDIIREVENYTEGAEGDSQVQALDPSQLSFLPRALSSRGAGTSAGNAGPSTSGAASWDVGPCYVCKEWVSRISIEKMASMAREYRLGLSSLAQVRQETTFPSCWLHGHQQGDFEDGGFPSPSIIHRLSPLIL